MLFLTVFALPNASRTGFDCNKDHHNKKKKAMYQLNLMPIPESYHHYRITQTKKQVLPQEPVAQLTFPLMQISPPCKQDIASAI